MMVIGSLRNVIGRRYLLAVGIPVKINALISILQHLKFLLPCFTNTFYKICCSENAMTDVSLALPIFQDSSFI